jgi:hypothetical protein
MEPTMTTTVTYPSLSEMEEWLTHTCDEPREPCSNNTCDNEAIAVVKSGCGAREPMCTLHVEEFEQFLSANARTTHHCKVIGWSGPLIEHFTVVPL